MSFNMRYAFCRPLFNFVFLAFWVVFTTEAVFAQGGDPYGGGNPYGGNGGSGNPPPGSSESNPSSTPLTIPFPPTLVLTYNGQPYTINDYGHWGNLTGGVSSIPLQLFNGTHNFDLQVSAHTGDGQSAAPGQSDPVLGAIGLSSYWTSQGYGFGGFTPLAPIKTHGYDVYFRKFAGTWLLGPPPASLNSGEVIIIQHIRREFWSIGQPLTRIYKTDYHPGIGGTIVYDKEINGVNYLYVYKVIASRLYKVQ